MIITQEGLNRIVNKFNKLQEEKRLLVIQKEEAANLGDRSENAEYQYAKEEIRRIDRELFKLNDIISKSTPINTEKRRKDRVVFGSYVKLQKNEEDLLIVKIVSTNELSFHKEEGVIIISNISPLGKIILGKEEGYEFDLNENEYKILEIF